MKKSLFVVILISILVLSVFVISAKENKSDKIEKKVLDKLKKEGKARVIVVLEDSPTKDEKKNQKFKTNQRNKIKEKIEERKIKHDFSYSNAFSARLSAEDIGILSLDNNVKQIYYDEPIKIFLQDSIPLVNATETWNLKTIDINLTGKGESVCIIDTGVDYTHPDLGNCTPVKYILNGTNESHILESQHNYTNNLDFTWNITKPGYSKIGIHFSNLSLECGWDYLYILDGNNKTVGVYSCTMNDFWSPSVDGDTIHIRLKTDESVTDYGFNIDQVINGTTNTTYDWSNCSKVVGGWDTSNYDPDPIDDEGHGTHVAGIVAANGIKKGVAPESTIISIKALDSGGNGWTGDIIAGIEWCVNRSEEFNISVISMSLGGNKNYTNYCDADYPIMSSAINSAVAKNISVVIAAGNSNNFTAISSPGCIQNATPIGSSDKLDGISSFSNRNWMVQLFAPGSSINSTKNGGGYEILSGTSMATPHVAGAFAIMNQFFRLNGIKKSPQEIESTFNATGKTIYDSSSGLNFSRINVYDAIISSNRLELVNPSESNNSFLKRRNILINISAKYVNFVNLTLYFYNSTGLINQTTTTSSNLFLNFTNLTDGIYYFNATAFDSFGNSNFSETRRATIDTIIPIVNMISPEEGYSATGTTTISFEYNVTESSTITNCSLLLNGGIAAYNSSEITNSTNSISHSLSAGSYNWSINCIDLAENIGNSSSRNLTINPAPSGGGGGGGPSSKTYKVTNTDLSAGVSTALRKGDKIEFESRGKSHTLKTNSIGANFADITIESDPINLRLFVGESRKLNLSSSDYYDFYVKLESVKSGKANITLMSIYEKIIVAEEEKESVVNDTKIMNISEKNEIKEEKITSNWRIYAIILITIGLVLFVVHWLIKNRKLRKRGKINLVSLE